VDLVTAAPSSWYRRWLRGIDLGEAAARCIAARLDRPYRATLRKAALAARQALRTESERRRLPRSAITQREGIDLAHLRILLVDDVWTTGTTLLRSAQALLDGGASEIRVLTLFRAL